MKNFINDLDRYNDLTVERQMEMTLQINEAMPSVPVILGRAITREAIKNSLIKKMAQMEQAAINDFNTIRYETRNGLKQVI